MTSQDGAALSPEKSSPSQGTRTDEGHSSLPAQVPLVQLPQAQQAPVCAEAATPRSGDAQPYQSENVALHDLGTCGFQVLSLLAPGLIAGSPVLVLNTPQVTYHPILPPPSVPEDTNSVPSTEAQNVIPLHEARAHMQHTEPAKGDGNDGSAHPPVPVASQQGPQASIQDNSTVGGQGAPIGAMGSSPLLSAVPQMPSVYVPAMIANAQPLGLVAVVGGTFVWHD
eukprot:scaffold853_cov386-Prasinococcus_capsulatus_cf.AAC.2